MRVTTRTALIALVACTLAAPSWSQDWAGKGRASGSVVDTEGEPIAGATVTLRQAASGEGPEPIQTGKNGRWSILGLDGGQWMVVVEAGGYKSAEGPYNVNPFNASPPLEITLVPNPFSSITVGDELLEAGDWAGARAEYEKALPNLTAVGAAALRSRIGDTHMGDGNYAQARTEYAEAMKNLAPAEQAHPRLQMANSYMSEGNHDEARSQFEALLPLLPPEGQTPVYLAIARTYDLQDRRDEAIISLEKALETSPGNVPVLQLIADLLVRAGRDDEAQAYLEQLPEDATLPPDMLLNVGIQKYNDGDLEGAMGYFNRAVEENPDMADTYYYRGLIYLNNGAKAEAAADFKKLIELDADSSHAGEAKEFLSYLESGS